LAILPCIILSPERAAICCNRACTSHYTLEEYASRSE
jgi:hypothetical protein